MRTPRLPILLLALAGLSGAAACAAQDDSDYRYDPPAQPQYSTDGYSTSDSYAYHDHDHGRGRYDDRYSDSALHDRVHRALWRSMGRSARGISVEVDDGNVYLSGWVASMREHDIAHDVAHQVRGVRAVYHDRLNVRRPYYERY